jgi:hypothetical protein
MIQDSNYSDVITPFFSERLRMVFSIDLPDTWGYNHLNDRKSKRLSIMAGDKTGLFDQSAC